MFPFHTRSSGSRTESSTGVLSLQHPTREPPPPPPPPNSPSHPCSSELRAGGEHANSFKMRRNILETSTISHKQGIGSDLDFFLDTQTDTQNIFQGSDSLYIISRTDTTSVCILDARLTSSRPVTSSLFDGTSADVAVMMSLPLFSSII